MTIQELDITTFNRLVKEIIVHEHIDTTKQCHMAPIFSIVCLLIYPHDKRVSITRVCPCIKGLILNTLAWLSSDLRAGCVFCVKKAPFGAQQGNGVMERVHDHGINQRLHMAFSRSSLTSSWASGWDICR